MPRAKPKRTRQQLLEQQAARVRANLSVPTMTVKATDSVAELEAKALEFCRAAKHSQRRRFGQPVACAQCLRTAILGRQKALGGPGLPVEATTLHRSLADILVAGGEYRISDLTDRLNEARGNHVPPYTQTGISARMRELAKWLPVRHKRVDGAEVYWMAEA